MNCEFIEQLQKWAIFCKFIDVKILKFDLVWAVKNNKIFIENGKRVSSTYKDIIKHRFIFFYIYELLMPFWIKIKASFLRHN